MKVAVTIVVNVDPKGWNDEYFSDDPAAKIRDDIKGMAEEAVEAAFKHVDHCVTVERKS